MISSNVVNCLKISKNVSKVGTFPHYQQIYTQKLKEGLTVKEIAERLHKTEDEVKALFSYFDTLSNFERDLANIDTKSR